MDIIGNIKSKEISMANRKSRLAYMNSVQDVRTALVMEFIFFLAHAQDVPQDAKK